MDSLVSLPSQCAQVPFQAGNLASHGQPLCLEAVHPLSQQRQLIVRRV